MSETFGHYDRLLQASQNHVSEKERSIVEGLCYSGTWLGSPCILLFFRKFIITQEALRAFIYLYLFKQL